MSALLSGLKRYVHADHPERIDSLTAVVAVTDDGGSSGRLRDEFRILPPGDVRSCIVALSDNTALLSRLFQYRFNGTGDLGGHSLGNLLLTALTEVQGDFLQAIKAASDVLAIKGTIYPATMQNVHLVADLENGTRLRGESTISKAGAPISAVRLEPRGCRPLPETLAALRAADIICVGPGSLFTSIVPNLLVPGVADAMRRSKAIKIFICNVMTQPGETPGMTASDHIRRVQQLCGGDLFDAILVNSTVPTAAALRRYRRDGADMVAVDRARFVSMPVGLFTRRLMKQEGTKVRHDPDRLARQILGLARRRAARPTAPRQPRTARRSA